MFKLLPDSDSAVKRNMVPDSAGSAIVELHEQVQAVESKPHPE